MVTVQLQNGKQLEVIDESVTYIKTSGDLGDITAVNSSYSWSMKFPKTPVNTRTLEGLGLVGSTSRKPYQKVYCNLLDNGLPIVIDGLLNIQETNDEYYGIYIQEGYVDFLRDIKTDTLGNDLDLTELDHVRDLATITSTFGGSLPYIYMIADFNGGYLNNVSDTTNMDVLYMIPFANVGYILQKIFDTYGWTYDIDPAIQAEIDSRWMSYPSEIVYDDSGSPTVLDIESNVPYTIPPFLIEGGNPYAFQISFPVQTLDSDYFILGSGGYNARFVCQEDGNYQFDVDIRGTSTSRSAGGIYTFVIRLYINGVHVQDIGQSNGTGFSFQRPLNDGDVVSFIAYSSIIADPEIEITLGEVDIKYLQTGVVSFTRALIKYRVSDFMKEIFTRFSLTPFVDSRSKNIELLTLDERLDADVVDWSDKYVKRENETYLYRDYAQENYFRHKYHFDGDDFNDGILPIENENLEEEKTVFQSESYSPDETFTTFEDNTTPYEVPKLRMFDVEIKEQSGSLIATYNRLKDRFFFATDTPLGRDIYIDGFIQDSAPLAQVGPSLFRNIIGTKYANFGRISTNAKVHNIVLALSQVDIIHLDLKKRYYFKQEASVYILNRLKWESGDFCTGEFIRVE